MQIFYSGYWNNCKKLKKQIVSILAKLSKKNVNYIRDIWDSVKIDINNILNLFKNFIFKIFYSLN